MKNVSIINVPIINVSNFSIISWKCLKNLIGLINSGNLLNFKFRHTKFYLKRKFKKKTRKSLNYYALKW